MQSYKIVSADPECLWHSSSATVSLFSAFVESSSESSSEPRSPSLPPGQSETERERRDAHNSRWIQTLTALTP
ncbi:unnamed protein product [Knipowitschia caucasica]